MYLFERQRGTELFHPLLPQVPAKAKAESDQSQEPGTPSVSSACHAPRCRLAENSNQKWNRTWTQLSSMPCRPLSVSTMWKIPAQ